MKSTLDHSPASAACLGAIFVFLLGLAGCSTVKSISPFTSSVPYAQDVQPTVARPASPEVPVYKKAAQPPEPAPVAESRPEPAPPQTEPKAAAPASAPPTAPAAPEPQESSAPPAVPPPVSPPASGTSPTPAPQTNSSTGSQDGAEPAKAGHGKNGDSAPPSIPPEQMAYNDSGRYRNLAEVPKRPTNLPTFAEARATEASLVAERNGSAPPTDATKASNATHEQDRAPCGPDPSKAKPEVTVRFDTGSTSLPADQRGVLGDALANVRSATGTIRVVGHGDAEPGAGGGVNRFDLAMGRASAVAQALAEFGIPAQRISIQVACDENPAAGASVQLFTAS
ncbi:MAG TPA: OmpA family protein [Alphaproteobacteria bacterium]|nr:OmpA family protein [Alphaproteobacteria bacterium]